MIVACPGCQLRYDVTGRPPGSRARCRCGTTFPLPDPAENAAALVCPGCGGSCSPTKTRCDFCSTQLATVRCPRCFGLLFLGAKHCAHCGTKIDAPARAPEGGEPSARTCPRCAAARSPATLVAELVGDTLIDRCDACGGLWIDQAAFERIVDDRERDHRALLPATGTGLAAQKGQRPDAAAPAPAPAVTYLKCPDCQGVMNRQNFGRRSGVIVDVCPAHGTWFDADELPRVIEFVRSGGLDDAYRREREEIERLRREEKAGRRAAALEAMRSPGGDPPSWGGSLGVFSTLGFLGRLFRIIE